MKNLLAVIMVMLPIFATAKEVSGWIGTYTTSNGNPTGSAGLYSLSVNAAGELREPALFVATDNPSFVIQHPSGRYLYSVNENSIAEGVDRVSAFELAQRGAAAPRLLGSVASGGVDPCYISLHPRNRWLFVANFGVKSSGSIAVLPVARDGSLGEAVQILRPVGSGPVLPRQQRAHTHQLSTTPDGRHVIAVDLGADKIFVFKFDERKGQLSEHSSGTYSAPAGSGPRHLVFTKDGHYAYVVTELNPGVITLRWDARLGRFEQIAVTPSLPDDFVGRRSSAEIVLHPSQRFLYVSNRGDSNSITRFTIDVDRIPHREESTSSGGRMPRFITTDPDGRFLLAANQATGEIVSFPLDASTGRLGAEISRVKVPAPVAITWDQR